jgi:hypothetical protein
VEWRKATKSNGASNCVEVRRNEEAIQVRDSKDPHGPILSFTSEEWTAFLNGAAEGEFDQK